MDRIATAFGFVHFYIPFNVHLYSIIYNIEKAFAKRGMHKGSDGWYDDGNFTTCGSLILKLSVTDWFMDNLLEWLWMDTTDSSVDDLKEFYSKEAAVG